jgi:flagella basal body P-ring formation protein FlgA
MTSIFRHAALGLLLIPQVARAEGWQNLDTVDAAVASSLVSGATAAPVDRRIKLAACAATLTIEPPVGGGVTVRCPSLGWRLRVLLASSAVHGDGHADATGPIVVKRGDALTVVTGADNFSVASAGTADSDGRVGDRLKVRVTPTGPAIMGQLIDPGTVRIF